MNAIFKIILIPYILCVMVFIIILASYIILIDPGSKDSFKERFTMFLEDEQKNHFMRPFYVSLIVWVLLFLSFFN